jgi:hypothetical protein
MTPERATRPSAREQRPDPGRPRLGAGTLGFLGSFVALLACLVSLLAANESEWPIFLLGLGGLLAGKAVGVPERSLTTIAIALILLAWPAAMFASPLPRLTSTISHLVIGALLAWLLLAPVLGRRPAASRDWILIPALVLSIGAVWELGEWLADVWFESDLAVNGLDTLIDLGADLIGAVAGVALYRRFPADSRAGRG